MVDDPVTAKAPGEMALSFETSESEAHAKKAAHLCSSVILVGEKQTGACRMVWGCPLPSLPAPQNPRA